MHVHYDRADQEDDWQYLCERMLECLISRKEEVFPNSLVPVISCYNRLQKLSEQGHSPFLIPSLQAGFQHFSALCKGLQLELVRSISTLIHIEDDDDDNQTMSKAVVEDDDDDGLFSDEYDTSIPKTTSEPVANRSTTPWDSFIELVCKDETPLSLLRALEKQSPGLARRMITRIFLELDPDGSNVHRKGHLGLEQATKWLNAVSRLSSILIPILNLNIKEELTTLKDESRNGRQTETLLFLTPLIRMAAVAFHATDGFTNPIIVHEFRQIPNFPMAVYARPPTGQVEMCVHAMRQSNRMAQRAIVSLVKSAMKEDKESIFEWIRLVVAKNNSLASLAKSELLDDGPSSIVSQSFTRSFLLGFSASFLDLCCRPLMDRHEAMGADAFDAVYLSDDVQWNVMFQGERHYTLASQGDAPTKTSAAKNVKYSGSTNFFFLATALLRVALYPTMKMEHEYYRANSRIYDVIRAQATEKDRPPLPEQFLSEASHKTSVWLGYKVQLEEPEFVSNVTSFTLLQLKWALAQCKAGQKANIPDWIVKDPARWLAQVGRQSPHLLRQNHAERAIECSTELLEVGQKSFSPIVMSCLLKIATAFVYAGIHRARQKQSRQNNRSKRWGNNGNDQEFDSRDPSIYLSFDKNDLGVTVFTNHLVCTRLCPTLIRTFVTLDVVEGLDMDREYDFDKFSAKNQIADLLLRLWSHPSGECRRSIVKDVKPDEFRSFGSSLVAALSVFFDDAVQKMSTTIKTIRSNSRSPNDQHFIDAHSSAAASGFVGARILLMLLCTLSTEPAIAASFGGAGTDAQNSAMRDMANMIVHFIDIITDQYGGTHPELELELPEPTYEMLQREPTMSTDEKNSLVGQIERSRRFSREEIGLDVSVVCQQLLALAAAWHDAAKKETNSKVSPLLDALVSHDDIDVKRWTQISNRMLVVTAQHGRSPQVEIFYRDGYRMPENMPTDTSNAGNQKEMRRRQTAKRDQMTHEEIDELLGARKNIPTFLDDLGRHLEELNSALEDTQADSIVEIQQSIMGNGRTIDEEDYGSDLGDFVVSSSPFASQSAPEVFVHYYDRTARSRSSAGSDKSLIREAKKCHKRLPTPHVNSSCFVCFAEERMDLCRAIITGPVDTPYAHGLFVFDIYFPPTYPSVPPLVTFMTTGGGQVRFNPNLYVDGKVCLSLLGLTFAQGESQRWNPQQSSLAQVLLSMQAQIFGVKEPYFNEGSGIPPQLRNTPAGREGSRKHNAMLRLATLRYAVVAHLRSPPLGFEEIAKRHFSMCQKRLLVQARRWMLEEEGTPSYPRFERVYGELVRLLMPLDYDAGKRLLPLSEDAAMVQEHDSGFPPIQTDEAGKTPPSDGESKPAAFAASSNNDALPVQADAAPTAASNLGRPEPQKNSDESYNPWANPGGVVSTPKEEESDRGDAGHDSDEDMYD